MLRNVSAAFFVLGATLVAGASASAPGPSGEYCGRLWSGGSMVEARTRFETASDGQVSGSYEFRDGDALTQGALRESAPPMGLTRTLRWSDTYGSGILHITFDPTFSRFSGHWGGDDRLPTEPWTGQRCEAATS